MSSHYMCLVILTLEKSFISHIIIIWIATVLILNIKNTDTF